MRVKSALYLAFLLWGSACAFSSSSKGCAFERLGPSEIDIGAFKRHTMFFLDGEKEKIRQAIGVESFSDLEKWVQAKRGSQAARIAMIVQAKLAQGIFSRHEINRLILEDEGLSLTPEQKWIVSNTLLDLAGGKTSRSLNRLKSIAKNNPAQFYDEFQQQLARVARKNLLYRFERFEAEQRVSEQELESLNGVFESLEVAPIAIRNDSAVRANVDPQVLVDMNLRSIAKQFHQEGIELLANGNRVEKTLWISESDRRQVPRKQHHEHRGPLATNLLGWDKNKRTFRIADAIPTLRTSDLVQLENRLKRTVEGLKRRQDSTRVDFEIEVYVADLQGVWTGIHGEILNPDGSRMLIDGRPVYLRVLED